MAFIMCGIQASGHQTLVLGQAAVCGTESEASEGYSLELNMLKLPQYQLVQWLPRYCILDNNLSR